MSPRSSTVVFDASKIEEAIEKAAQAVSANISYPEIPEELFEVFAYLPELFQDGDEERYICLLYTSKLLFACIIFAGFQLFDIKFPTPV